jgi:hypothetical protein
MAYVLAPGVHCCDVSGRLVFLDVRRDRYFGLDDDGDAAVRAALAGPGADPAQPAFRSLIARGVLRFDPAGGATSSAPAVAVPRRSLLDEARPDATVIATARAALAIVRARRRLRRHGFAASLAGLECLKSARSGAGDPAPIAAAFDLSRMILDSLDQCLPHAIALAGTLFQKDCDAEFVIAVRRRPFRAHSWVQAGDRVLNDRLDHVRGFQPILVI